MSVLQTQKIHICALKSSRKQILEELQRSGLVQVEAEGGEDAIFRKTDTSQTKSKFEKYAKNAELALKTLDAYAPEKKGLLASLEGKEQITAERYYESVKERSEVLQAVNEILALQKQVAEAGAGVVRTDAMTESLVPWMSLDVPMSSKGTRTTAAILGALPGQWTLEQVLAKVGEAHPELEAYEVEILGADRDQTCIFAVCPKADEPILEDALRVNGFVRPTFATGLTPKAYEAQLKKEREAYVAAEKKAVEGIKVLAKQRQKLQFAADYYRMRAGKYQVLGELLQSDHVFFVNGYIPAYLAGDFKKKLESSYTCEVELSEPEADEDAPILLQNSAFTSPTESVVESYGLPKRGEVDPTQIMAIFYYIFFGLMLSDAGYGLLMVIGCGLALKKFANMDKGMKKMLTMFFWCGVSTAIWGLLFGGFFGDVIDIVSSTFFGVELSLPALWFVPLNDPMRLLIYSFLFGLIHLFFGLGLKGYMILKEEKDVLSFFSNVVCWYLLLLGLILILLPTDIFASMSGSVIVFPAFVGVLAKWMAIVGAVGILLFSKRDASNFGLRIALGAYELYGISSWLSDVLSYSRLLALGLATGVIASVINTMGSMLGSGIIGFILFWIIFLVGHTLNMAINILGAYVHTNRLQFVEFFGKFYEGGGRPFRPFSASDNKFFTFKEEK